MLKLVENCFCFRRNDDVIKSNDKQTQDAAKANSAARGVAQQTVFVFAIYFECTNQFQQGNILQQRDRKLSNGRDSISSMTVSCVRICSLESEASRMWKNLHFNYVFNFRLNVYSLRHLAFAFEIKVDVAYRYSLVSFVREPWIQIEFAKMQTPCERTFATCSDE